MNAVAAQQRATRVRRLPAFDGLLAFVVLALLGFGLVMVASASLHLGDKFGQPFHYVQRHLIALMLGSLGALAILRLPTRYWERASTWLYFLGLLLLVAVLIPGIGREANGATRWIPLGAFNLQSSEFMKLFMVLYMGGYLVRRRLEVAHSVKGFLKPLLLLGVACSLIMVQPDFGTTTVLLLAALGMLFLGGAPLWQFMTLILGVGGTLAALVVTSDYRMERITGFLNPWADVNGSGYQLAQALIAFGRGEWSGVGLGNGIQKQFYLPEAHTDFIMAVIGEEFGLLGTLTVILLFGLFVWRAFAIGAAAETLERRFSAYVAYGIGIWIGLQAFVNIGVNVGLLPTKGITLPFMSYGGNSIIVACLVAAMLLRIDFENRREEAPQREGRAWARA